MYVRMYVCVSGVNGFGGARENVEFLSPVAGTYQGFFTTKRTLFLETRPGAVVASGGEEEEETG